MPATRSTDAATLSACQIKTRSVTNESRALPQGHPACPHAEPDQYCSGGECADRGVGAGPLRKTGSTRSAVNWPSALVSALITLALAMRRQQANKRDADRQFLLR